MKVLPCIKISSVASMRMPLPAGFVIVLPCITEAGVVGIGWATEALNRLCGQVADSSALQ